jgi:hydrogenase-4 component B
LHQPLWIALGFGGGLLHVINHALFKSLLFFGAGGVVHATGTREMDRLGGLMKKMPRTGLFFLVGAVAICGLPPLNGFVSEWLVYLGLFGTVLGKGARFAPFAAPALALIGALAVACFVKAFGTVFLGEPRTEDGARAHDAPLLATPMAVLALLCAAIGLLPQAVAPLLDAAVRAVAPAVPGIPPLRAAAPMVTLSVFHIALALVLGAFWLLLAERVRSAKVGSAPTWDCGYAAPSPRMQYTSSSFARWTVGFFRWGLRPNIAPPRVDRLFPREARFSSHVPETVLERVFQPLLSRGARLLMPARFLQQGRIQLYLLYVALTLVALLLWK